MSALPREWTNSRRSRYVRLVPKPALSRCSKTHAYSITSSARNKSDVAIDRPRACAVRMSRCSKTHAYSITSSARNKSDVAIDRPRACAVRMLSTVSNFVGRSIGNSAGLAPRRTLPVTTPLSRSRLSRFGP